MAVSRGISASLYIVEVLSGPPTMFVRYIPYFLVDATRLSYSFINSTRRFLLESILRYQSPSKTENREVCSRACSRNATATS